MDIDMWQREEQGSCTSQFDGLFQNTESKPVSGCDYNWSVKDSESYKLHLISQKPVSIQEISSLNNWHSSWEELNQLLSLSCGGAELTSWGRENSPGRKWMSKLGFSYMPHGHEGEQKCKCLTFWQEELAWCKATDLGRWSTCDFEVPAHLWFLICALMLPS